MLLGETPKEKDFKYISENLKSPRNPVILSSSIGGNFLGSDNPVILKKLCRFPELG